MKGRFLNFLNWKQKKKLVLNRAVANNYGVFGVLYDENIEICKTLELPWDRNLPNISCIIADLYLVKRVNSPHFGDTFEIQNVVGRTDILFHCGNTKADLKGCIAVGTSIDSLFTRVNNSRIAFNGFMQRLKGINEFTIDIKWEV